MLDIQPLLTTCELAARAGAEQLMAWRGRFSTREKSAFDLVTDADLASQEAIQAAISKEFPDHGFLGEESPAAEQLAKPYCWVVDPLDGTTNYVHDFPFFAVSVAVVQAGKVVAGAIFDPLRDELFLAGAGLGATLNGKPFTTSGAEVLGKSLLAVSFPPNLNTDMPDLKAFLRAAPKCLAVRRTGSAAMNLAYVACGRLDGHWAFNIHPWDSAAGVLLVSEAGGIATSCQGKNYDVTSGDYLVAATPQLHQDLLQTILSD